MSSDYRLISLDLLGHGLTGTHPQSSYGIDGLFDAVVAVIDELVLSEEKLVLVGILWGDE